jgi:hypothetical protein
MEGGGMACLLQVFLSVFTTDILGLGFYFFATTCVEKMKRI